MKALKTMLVVVLAITAIAMIPTLALAHSGGMNAMYGSSSPTQEPMGMMGGYTGGHMSGYMRCRYYGGCGMRYCWGTRYPGTGCGMYYCWRWR